MTVYEFDTFRDLKVYNVNVKNNKHVMVMFSGTWFPSLTKWLSAVCDYMILNHANVFDVYVVSSEQDYVQLYYDNVIFEYLQTHNKPVTCLCFCLSASFLSHIIYKLNKTMHKISLICYESSFDNYKQGLGKPYIGTTMNKQYLCGDKQTRVCVNDYLSAQKMIDDMISKAMTKHNISRREAIQMLRINMKSKYDMFHISSKNDPCFDYDANMQFHRRMKKHREFKIRCYTLESYSHTFLLTNPLLFESKQIQLFYRHLDDIIARIIQ